MASSPRTVTSKASSNTSLPKYKAPAPSAVQNLQLAQEELERALQLSTDDSMRRLGSGKSLREKGYVFIADLDSEVSRVTWSQDKHEQLEQLKGIHKKTISESKYFDKDMLAAPGKYRLLTPDQAKAYEGAVKKLIKQREMNDAFFGPGGGGRQTLTELEAKLSKEKLAAAKLEISARDKVGRAAPARSKANGFKSDASNLVDTARRLGPINTIFGSLKFAAGNNAFGRKHPVLYKMLAGVALAGIGTAAVLAAPVTLIAAAVLTATGSTVVAVRAAASVLVRARAGVKWARSIPSATVARFRERGAQSQRQEVLLDSSRKIDVLEAKIKAEKARIEVSRESADKKVVTEFDRAVKAGLEVNHPGGKLSLEEISKQLDASRKIVYPAHAAQQAALAKVYNNNRAFFDKLLQNAVRKTNHGAGVESEFKIAPATSPTEGVFHDNGTVNMSEKIKQEVAIDCATRGVDVVLTELKEGKYALSDGKSTIKSLSPAGKSMAEDLTPGLSSASLAAAASPSASRSDSPGRTLEMNPLNTGVNTGVSAGI